MATVEDRIIGGDPRGKVLGLEPKRSNILETSESVYHSRLPRMFGNSLPAARFEPFTGQLLLATYRERQDGATEKQVRRFGSLEDMTAAAIEIYNAYDPNGVKGRNLAELQGHIMSSASRFIGGHIDREALEVFDAETMDVLVRLGFSSPRRTNKIMLVQQVEAAMRVDSLGRINPLVSRTRLASALMKTYLEELAANRVEQKYLNLFLLLIQEQAIEETAVKGIIAEIENADSDLRELFDAGRRQTVKAAPWRRPIMRAYASVACNRRTASELQRYFPNESPLWNAEDDAPLPIDVIRPALLEELKQSLEDGTNIYAPSSV